MSEYIKHQKNVANKYVTETIFDINKACFHPSAFQIPILQMHISEG
jgi:hypothetical protein